MKHCSLLEEEKRKSKHIIKIFALICFVQFIAILYLILKYNNFDFKFFDELNWTAIGTIVAGIAIVSTLIISKNEIKESVKNQIIITELEKFKDNLNYEINKYVDFSNELFNYGINLDTSRPDIISSDDLNKIYIVINKYNTFIFCVIQNINYYYGNYDNNERPIFNNFITELYRINSIMSERIGHFIAIADKMNKVNAESIEYHFKNNNENQSISGDIHKKAIELVNDYYRERQKLMLSNDDIVKIKQQALNVIEERKNIIKKNLDKIYKI